MSCSRTGMSSAVSYCGPSADGGGRKQSRAPGFGGLPALMIPRSYKLLRCMDVRPLQGLFSLQRYPAPLCCCVLISAATALVSHCGHSPPANVDTHAAVWTSKALCLCLYLCFTDFSQCLSQRSSLESLKRPKEGPKHALVALLHGRVLLPLFPWPLRHRRLLWHLCVLHNGKARSGIRCSEIVYLYLSFCTHGCCGFSTKKYSVRALGCKQKCSRRILQGQSRPQAACSRSHWSHAKTPLLSRERIEAPCRGFQKEGRTAARELPTTTAADSTFFLGGTAGRGGGPGRGGPGRGGPGSAAAPAGSSPEGRLCGGLLRPFWCPEKLLAPQGLWRHMSALQLYEGEPWQRASSTSLI